MIPPIDLHRFATDRGYRRACALQRLAHCDQQRAELRGFKRFVIECMTAGGYAPPTQFPWIDAKLAAIDRSEQRYRAALEE